MLVFTVARRGYDSQEVEAAFDRAAADYAAVVTDRDELARSELQARERISTLEQDVRELAAAPIDGENLSARLRYMLKVAQEEASEIRSRAHAGATGMVEQARAHGRALHDEASARARALHEQAESTSRQRVAEASDQAGAIVLEAERQARKLRHEAEDADAQRRREACEAHARALAAQAEADADRVKRDAHDERLRLDEAVRARCAQAEQDFQTAPSTTKAWPASLEHACGAVAGNRVGPSARRRARGPEPTAVVPMIRMEQTRGAERGGR